MKPQALLSRFECVVDGPEATSELRKVVIGLAISGRLLVPSGEIGSVAETSAALLEVLRRVPAGRGTLEEVAEDDIPDVLSRLGRFVRLRSVAEIRKGPTAIKQAKPGEYPLVVTAEGRQSCDHYDFDAAGAIIPLVSSTGHGHASIHRLQYQDGRFALGSILCGAFPHAPDLISARFIYEYLSTFKDELLVSQMLGTANVSLTVKKVGAVPIPVVSPAVQRQVNQLMAVCDQLDAAQTELETGREKVAAALWRGLREFTSASREHGAANLVSELPRVLTRPERVGDLRRAVLDVAVSGRLVKQDSAEEPAQALLARVHTQPRSRRSSRAASQTSKVSLPPRPDVPQTWDWAHLGELITNMDSGWSPQCDPGPRTSDGVWGVLRTTAVQRLRFNEDEHKVLPRELKPRPEYAAREGDILITRAGPRQRVGVCCLVESVGPRLMISDKLIRFHLVSEMNPRFVALALNAGHSLDAVEAIKTGMAVMQMNVSQDRLRQVPIPVPPLSEQERIVDSVDGAMAMCDGLETSLVSSARLRVQLLRVILRQTLGSGFETEVGAAC